MKNKRMRGLRSCMAAGLAIMMVFAFMPVLSGPARAEEAIQLIQKISYSGGTAKVKTARTVTLKARVFTRISYSRMKSAVRVSVGNKKKVSVSRKIVREPQSYQVYLKVKGISSGTTAVKMIVGDKSTKWTVRVSGKKKVNVSRVSPKASKFSLLKGKSKTLKVKVSAPYLTRSEAKTAFIPSSKNVKVSRVKYKKSGSRYYAWVKVTAKKAGTCRMKAKSTSGDRVAWTIQVKEPAPKPAPQPDPQPEDQQPDQGQTDDPAVETPAA